MHESESKPLSGPWVGVVWAVMPVLLLIVAGVALVLWHLWPWGSR